MLPRQRRPGGCTGSAHGMSMRPWQRPHRWLRHPNPTEPEVPVVVAYRCRRAPANALAARCDPASFAFFTSVMTDHRNSAILTSRRPRAFRSAGSGRGRPPRSPGPPAGAGGRARETASRHPSTAPVPGLSAGAVPAGRRRTGRHIPPVRRPARPLPVEPHTARSGRCAPPPGPVRRPRGLERRSPPARCVQCSGPTHAGPIEAPAPRPDESARPGARPHTGSTAHRARGGRPGPARGHGAGAGRPCGPARGGSGRAHFARTGNIPAIRTTDP